MMYNELVEYLFFYPMHVGVLCENQPEVVSVHVNQNKRTVAIDFYLNYSQQGVILKACFKAKGNPYLIASMELLSRKMEGMNINDPDPFNYKELVSALEMPLSEYPLALLVDSAYQKSVILIKEKLKRNKS